MFTQCKRTESLLDGLNGVSYDLTEVTYEELAENWDQFNAGRPESQARIEEAVTDYAARMEKGSAAPSVILWKSPSGKLSVLDGCQRLLANDLLGHTKFGAYVVTCHESMSRKIRLIANVRLNGSAPVNPEWTLKRLIEEFMIGESKPDSAADIAALYGTRTSRVEELYSVLKFRQLLEKAYDGQGKSMPGKLTDAHVRSISKTAEEDDFRLAQKEIVKASDLILGCNFANGDGCRLFEQLFSFKRTGAKTRSTQFNSKLKELRKDPVVVSKLAVGNQKIPAIENVARQLKALHRVILSYKKSKHAYLDNEEIVSSWEDKLSDCCRILRELCSTEVRSKLDPFVYGRPAPLKRR